MPVVGKSWTKDGRALCCGEGVGVGVAETSYIEDSGMKTWPCLAAEGAVTAFSSLESVAIAVNNAY